MVPKVVVTTQLKVNSPIFASPYHRLRNIAASSPYRDLLRLAWGGVDSAS